MTCLLAVQNGTARLADMKSEVEKGSEETQAERNRRMLEHVREELIDFSYKTKLQLLEFERSRDWLS